MELYATVNAMDDKAILENQNNWKVIYNGSWEDIQKGVTKAAFSKQPLIKEFKLRFTPKKKNLILKSKFPKVSFKDKLLNQGLITFAALFEPIYKANNLEFQFDEKKGKTFKIVPV